MSVLCIVLMRKLASRHETGRADALRRVSFFLQLVALLDQPVEFFLLLGDAGDIAILILGARQRGGLLDQLPDVVTGDGDALLEFGKRKRRAIGHRVSPVLGSLRDCSRDYAT